MKSILFSCLMVLPLLSFAPLGHASNHDSPVDSSAGVKKMFLMFELADRFQVYERTPSDDSSRYVYTQVTGNDHVSSEINSQRARIINAPQLNGIEAFTSCLKNLTNSRSLTRIINGMSGTLEIINPLQMYTFVISSLTGHSSDSQMDSLIYNTGDWYAFRDGESVSVSMRDQDFQKRYTGHLLDELLDHMGQRCSSDDIEIVWADKQFSSKRIFMTATHSGMTVSEGRGLLGGKRRISLSFWIRSNPLGRN